MCWFRVFFFYLVHFINYSVVLDTINPIIQFKIYLGKRMPSFESHWSRLQGCYARWNKVLHWAFWLWCWAWTKGLRLSKTVLIVSLPLICQSWISFCSDFDFWIFSQKGWETTNAKEEHHPNPHGNGVMTSDFFKNDFGLTGRESAALLIGAHSFGTFNGDISQFRYDWTRKQASMLNNQLFRYINISWKYCISLPQEDI